MPCTNRIERYSVTRNDDLDFAGARKDVLRETSRLCSNKPTGQIKYDNATLHFLPQAESAAALNDELNCYLYYRVHANDLRLVTTWVNDVANPYKNIVVFVSGKKLTLDNFRMIGFNPRRTLLVFCSIYATHSMYNSKIHASVLAPTVSFTFANSIVNDSMILGGLRGSLATLNVPYVTC